MTSLIRTTRIVVTIYFLWLLFFLLSLVYEELFLYPLEELFLDPWRLADFDVFFVRPVALVLMAYFLFFASDDTKPMNLFKRNKTESDD